MMSQGGGWGCRQLGQSPRFAFRSTSPAPSWFLILFWNGSGGAAVLRVATRWRLHLLDGDPLPSFPGDTHAHREAGREVLPRSGNLAHHRAEPGGTLPALQWLNSVIFAQFKFCQKGPACHLFFFNPCWILSLGSFSFPDQSPLCFYYCFY